MHVADYSEPSWTAGTMGGLRPNRKGVLLATVGMLALTGTASSHSGLSFRDPRTLVSPSAVTSNQFGNPALDLGSEVCIRVAPGPTEAARPALSVLWSLKRISGLTWAEISDAMGVSRRTLHNWAEGKPLSRENEAKLRRVEDVVRVIDRGTVRANRELLRFSQDGASNPLNLLRQNDYAGVVAVLGRGGAHRVPALQKLDDGARADRAPETLVSRMGKTRVGTPDELPGARPARSRRAKG